MLQFVSCDMAEIFLTELEALITASNKSVIEEGPSCKNKEENYIRNDVIGGYHGIDSCILGVELIVRRNRTGSGE